MSFSAGPDGLQVNQMYGGWEGSSAKVAVGQRPWGSGSSLGSGIVLSSTESIAGLVVASTSPFRLPFLGWIGDMEGEVSIGQLSHHGDFAEPWVANMRLGISPHPRWDLTVSRAAMFAGEGNTSLSLRNLLSLLAGQHGGETTEFENQLASVGARVRPAFRPLPFEGYVEWGFEDSAGAWWDVPGVQAGILLPELPGAPRWNLLVEHTRFASRCCGNPPWYRHMIFREGWTREGKPLGHPLGGEGQEWRVQSGGPASRPNTRLNFELFHRNRTGENLYAPVRLGASLGGSFSFDSRLSEHWSLRVESEAEKGDDWNARATRMFLRWTP